MQFAVITVWSKKICKFWAKYSSLGMLCKDCVHSRAVFAIYLPSNNLNLRFPLWLFLALCFWTHHVGPYSDMQGPLPYGCGRAAAFVDFSRLFFPLPFLLCFIGILIFSKSWLRLFFLCRATKKLSFVPADVNLGCEMSLWPSLTVHTPDTSGTNTEV